MQTRASSALSCPATPSPEAASLQGKPPGTGRGEKQRKYGQQAVTFSQKATHVQSSQGLGLIHHHTTLTSAPSGSSCCKVPTSNTHTRSPSRKMCNTGLCCPGSAEPSTLQAAAPVPQASHPAEKAKLRAAHHPRRGCLAAHAHSHIHLTFSQYPQDCPFTSFSLAFTHFLASSSWLLLVYARHAFLLASLAISSVPQR